jgi:hypothetical protein
MMAGRLESAGAFQDPAFADKFSKASYGQKKGLYADAMLRYEQQMQRDQEIWRMNQKKEFMQWSDNIDRKRAELPPEEQELLPRMVTDYLTGATQGLQPDQNFLQKIFSMSGRGVNTFFQMVGKGMELFDAANPQQVQAPQFQQAPGGGRVMVNPNNGTAQFIPDEKAAGTPSYAEIPAPAPGTVGVLNDGRGSLRVIPGGTPASAPGPSGIFGGATGQDALPKSTPEEADRRLRSMNLLFGE